MAILTHAFRTDPRKAVHITGHGCLLGYAVILLAVPLAGWGLGGLVRLTATADTPLGPALATAEGYFRLLALSYLLSWPGALVSIPLVLLARVHGLLGWGSAMLGAVVIMGLITWGMMGATVADALRQFTLPAATLGLSFWLAVRLANPRGFG